MTFLSIPKTKKRVLLQMTQRCFAPSKNQAQYKNSIKIENVDLRRQANKITTKTKSQTASFGRKTEKCELSLGGIKKE